KRRHRPGRRQPLLPGEFAPARVRDLQQPPHDLPVERRGELLLAAGEWRASPERRVVLSRSEAGGADGEGPGGILEGCEGRVNFVVPAQAHCCPGKSALDWASRRSHWEIVH